MAKLSIRVEVQCTKCGGAVLSRSDEPANDPVIICAKCGNPIGPQSSIEAVLRGQTHTPLGGSAVSVIEDLD